MEEELKKLTKEELLSMVEEFEHYPTVTEDDDKDYILSYLKDESCTISEKEIGVYLLKNGVEINKDNIHLYYQFMDKEDLETHSSLLNDILLNRFHNVRNTIKVEDKKFEPLKDYNIDLAEKSNNYIYVSIFGVKDNLQPIEKYIDEVKNSDGYKNYISENPVNILDSVKENGWHLEGIDKQTHELCIDAVKQNGYALQYVKEQTPEICLAAIKQNGTALCFVKEQTPDLCLEAVKLKGWALEYVKEQTPEICIEAVKQNGFALKYVENQTSEICLAAVKQNGYALKYVENQTSEICEEAIKQNPTSSQFIKETTISLDEAKKLVAEQNTPGVKLQQI